jgi:hypothetical protein
MKYTVEVVKGVNSITETRWYKEGTNILHRENGPAMEATNGHKAWFINGKCHKEDGPAVLYYDGHKEWFIDGRRLSEKEFDNRGKSCSGTIVEVEGKKYKLVEL